MDKLLIFGGTYEGRVLCQFLNDNKIEATVSVATKYGEEIISNLEFIKVIQGRLDKKEIENLIKIQGYSRIIDATHPYAALVSENIKEACKLAEVEYVRLLREEVSYQNLIMAENTEEAVKMLNQIEGNIFLTTGSKELSKYTLVTDFEKRVFARVLPSKEVVESCNLLGIKGKNLICMQGPFSKELNIAMLKDFNCSVIVTKDTGIVGGFDEKIQAANQVGAKVIVIKRPCDKSEVQLSQSLTQVKEMLIQKTEILIPKTEKHTTNVVEVPHSCDNKSKKCNKSTDLPSHRYFPLFVDSVDKIAVIIGAGKIALGRAEKLKGFGFEIRIVAEEFVYKPEKTICIEKSFEDSDIRGAFLVVAATNKRDINSYISRLCKDKNIFCSVADKGSEGDFIFPALVSSHESLIAISSDGKSPKSTKLLAKKLRDGLNLNLEVSGEDSCR